MSRWCTRLRPLERRWAGRLVSTLEAPRSSACACHRSRKQSKGRAPARVMDGWRVEVGITALSRAWPRCKLV
eukprot:1338103-Prymnesium_polylepis.1